MRSRRREVAQHCARARARVGAREAPPLAPARHRDDQSGRDLSRRRTRSGWATDRQDELGHVAARLRDRLRLQDLPSESFDAVSQEFQSFVEAFSRTDPCSQRSLPDSSGTSRRSTSRRSTIRSCRRSSSRARASASTRLRCDTKRRTAEANARAWATLASWGHGLEAYRPSHTRTGAPSQRRHTAVAQLHVCRGFHGRSGFGRRRFLQALCKHRTARRCIRMQSRCPALMRKSPCCAVSLQEAAPRCSLGRVAMQKVVGSNPIIRFRKAPATAGFCLPARRLRRHLKRHLRHFCPFVPNQRR